jgi:signal transduction histidine kinase
MPSRTRRSGLTVLAASLLGLLLVLAALQYRWLGQLGDAELARLRAGTRARTAQFAQEFDREITRAFLWLRLDPTTMHERGGDGFAGRFDRWTREAPHPRLVASVFWMESRPRGPWRAHRFDPARRTFEPTGLPEALADLALPPLKDGRGRGTFFDAIWEEAPALVYVVPAREPWPGREARPPDVFPLAGYAVILLDRAYLLEEFVPALVRRHFPADEGVEPFVEIVSRKEPSVPVYRSGATDRSGAPRQGDASAGLFAISVGEANRDLLAGMDFRRTLTRMPSRTRRSAGREDGASAVIAGVRADRPRFTGAAPGGGGRWQLVLSHRGGSLEDVVAGMRRRNLAVSFGILVVLAVGVVMTVVATLRAQRLARAEVEFVAGVSHELSTPLSVICVAGENLADGLLGGGEPVRRYGALVRDEGRRLRELVDQVLVFSTPGTLVARRERVDLVGLVKGALEPCRTDIETQRFEVRTEIAAGLPLVVGDEAMLRRAVQNLLSNAIKYSGSSRRLCVLVGAAPPGHGPQVWLTVRDEGLGIDPADLPRIFEPFYRSREARARQIRGSGLGLSLVRRIAEQHGGRVTVESEPGRGSSFTIRLPASEHAWLEGSASPLEGHEQAHPAG